SADPTGLNWCLHLEGYQVPTQLASIEQARARGFTTSMQSTGLPPQWLRQYRNRMFESFDIVMLHQESLDYVGLGKDDPTSSIRRLAELAKAARAPWPRIVVVTLGKHGAAAVTQDGAVVCAPALPVTVVDTTGAGDSFVGCFLAVWLNCADAALAIRLACIAGSLQVTRFGAQEIRPSASTLARLAPQAAAAATHA
ncbi:MAG: carbohydrate kinase family protein, partial [Variovorax sp.]